MRNLAWMIHMVRLSLPGSWGTGEDLAEGAGRCGKDQAPACTTGTGPRRKCGESRGRPTPFPLPFGPADGRQCE